MITVRVFLKCQPSANRPGGDYNTFIALPTRDFLSGRHIEIAKRRACVVGYEGTCEVTEVRRLDATAISNDDLREGLAELSTRVRATGDNVPPPRATEPSETRRQAPKRRSSRR